MTNRLQVRLTFSDHTGGFDADTGEPVWANRAVIGIEVGGPIDYAGLLYPADQRLLADLLAVLDKYKDRFHGKAPRPKEAVE